MNAEQTIIAATDATAPRERGWHSQIADDKAMLRAARDLTKDIAVARGATVFDFGRSKEGTGSYSFKKNWGFEPQPLPYQYHLVRSPEVPNLSPMNPKYRAMIAVWKRLPLWVTHVAGPMIARHLG